MLLGFYKWPAELVDAMFSDDDPWNPVVITLKLVFYGVFTYVSIYVTVYLFTWLLIGVGLFIRLFHIFFDPMVQGVLHFFGGK
jgi:hypothetical protein